MSLAIEPSGELLTPHDVYRALHIAPATLRRWADMGAIESTRTPGGHRRYTRADVDRLSATPPTKGPDDQILAP